MHLINIRCYVCARWLWYKYYLVIPQQSRLCLFAIQQFIISLLVEKAQVNVYVLYHNGALTSIEQTSVYICTNIIWVLRRARTLNIACVTQSMVPNNNDARNRVCTYWIQIP